MGGHPGPERAYDMMGAAPIRLKRVSRGAGDGDVIPLARPRGVYDPRVTAVFMALGAIVLALAAFAVLWFFELAFSIWGSKTTSIPEMTGLTIAGVGIACAIAYAIIETRLGPPRFVKGSETLKIFLPELRKPLIVDRTHVRVVAIDNQPVQYFKNNKRFPIMGLLPEAIFADALDRGTHPWDPGEPQPRMPRDPAMVAGTAGDSAQPEKLPWETSGPVPPPEPAEHEPGWATVGSRPASQRGIRGYLFTAEGSALPVFTYNPADIPNLAVIFTEPLRIRSGVAAKIPVRLRGSRMPMRGTNASQVRGLLVKAVHAEMAAERFRPWNVVRDISADDVLESGLRPPKALKGLRLAAYAVAMLAPLILKIVLRNRW